MEAINEALSKIEPKFEHVWEECDIPFATVWAAEEKLRAEIEENRKNNIFRFRKPRRVGCFNIEWK
jgi:hypothetical protein